MRVTRSISTLTLAPLWESIPSTASSKSHEKGCERQTVESASEEIQAGRIQTETSQDIVRQAPVQAPEEVDAGPNAIVRDPLVVKTRKTSVGFVIFMGNPGKIASKSLQFSLPLQFFLPLPPVESDFHVKR